MGYAFHGLLQANNLFLPISLASLMCVSARMIHVKCRSEFYPFGNAKRLIIDDAQVPWDIKFSEYDPPEYNSPSLKGKPWADPDIDDPNFHPKFNELDGRINRRSHGDPYLIQNKRPLNPWGRTGLKGRGVLGRWGPNHAADPIVTRWKFINGTQAYNADTKLPILQFCAIQRRDSGEWAIPGGMVDPGENVSETLKREFLEEALNILEADKDQVKKDEAMIKNFFKLGVNVYLGYVDDPRNTDNAWMETVAMNFHDDDGTAVAKFELKAGDDAKNVQWMDINSNLKLYANHAHFIKKVVEMRRAHW